MSYPSLGKPDPLSRPTVEALVSAIRPDWQLVDAEPMPESSDIVSAVTVANAGGSGETPTEREAVLKCFRDAEALAFRTPERFLVETDLLDIVGRETELPVPVVFGVCESHEELPAPAFLMQRLAGESASDLPIRETSEVGERFLRECGRALARIHELRSFDAFGDLVTASSGQDGFGSDGIAVENGASGWSDRLEDIVTGALDDVDDRFADLEAPLRDYADDRLDSLDLAAEPGLLHGDYRPGNLLADPATGELTALLDWGAAQAGDPRYELAWAVREFSNRAPVDSTVRRRVRETLLGAYESERGAAFERDAAFDRRQRFYLAVTWITELGSFDLWWAGADESVRATRAEQLRQTVRSLY